MDTRFARFCSGPLCQAKESQELDRKQLGENIPPTPHCGASYLREIEFVTPSHATKLDELTAVNPALATLLPDLEALLNGATVSPRYKQLLSTKTKYLRAGTFPTSHNLFDCKTFLQLTHPENGRKVLWLRADMDVVTDGTDPDRAPLLSDYDLARTSNSFLPLTKFGWPKSGPTPQNPFVDYYP